MSKTSKIEVLSTAVTVQHLNDDDYISLTDIARHRDVDRSDDLIRN